MGVITFKMPDQKKFDIIIERLEELKDTKPLMAHIAGLLRIAVRENFKEEGRPVKWAPLSAKYGAKKEAAYGKEKKILNLTGHMLQDIMEGFGKDYAQVSSDKVYAAAQNFGYAKRGIPARPFMTITDEDRDEITEEIRNHIARKLGIKRS
jgi:phage virion morphogenesis protein